MIPIIQFDPSSLTIWYDTHLIARMRGADEIGVALDLALRGQDDVLATHIRTISDDWISTRAATIAAACWHEKRHFVDFVLTNYGALRIRQFFMVYLNLPRILQCAKENGELLVPIQSYREKLFCAALGVKHPNPDILRSAGEIHDRKIMLSEDRSIFQSRFGDFEVGGESLLETIAHYTQNAKAERLLGREYSSRIQHDVPDHSVVSARYTWAYRVLISAGLIDPLPSEEGFLAIRDHPILPICYAALAQRAWKQPQARAEAISSFHPSERFGSLVIALRDHREAVRKGSVLSTWAIVNKVAKEIFGRTVIEEMDRDIALEEEFIKSVRLNAQSKNSVRAYEDYHDLRVKLFSEFARNPSCIIDQRVYAGTTDRRIKPYVIVAASGGVIGDPPPDYSRVLGYKDPEHADQREDARWWWAASLKDPPRENNDVSLLARDQWMEVVSDFAPAAKLIMDGRNVRTMLGPEILSVEARLLAAQGIRFIVDPRHSHPKISIPSDFWYYITGRDTHRCDLTYKTVHKPMGIVADCWALRLRPGLFDALLGGGYADRIELMLSFWRDWSPWFFSEEFRDRFNQFKEDQMLLVTRSD